MDVAFSSGLNARNSTLSEHLMGRLKVPMLALGAIVSLGAPVIVCGQSPDALRTALNAFHGRLDHYVLDERPYCPPTATNPRCFQHPETALIVLRSYAGGSDEKFQVRVSPVRDSGGVKMVEALFTEQGQSSELWRVVMTPGGGKVFARTLMQRTFRKP
jgi:hypothetical protein